MVKQNFADELINRVISTVDPVDVIFLKVMARGLELSLFGCRGLPQRVLVVPGMILVAVWSNESSGGESFFAQWNGPTFECDRNRSREKPRYTERKSFHIEVPKLLVEQGKIVRISPSQVTKMKHHVPAVLFNSRS